MTVQTKRNVESIGFINHARMAFTSEPEKLSGKIYKPHLLEKIGGKLTWCVTQMPKKIWSALHNPKVITVALTVLAMTTVQFAFYHRITYIAIRTVCVFIVTRIPAHIAKLSIYAITQMNVLGFGIRAFGRFSNVELMNNWYTKEGHRAYSA